MIWSAMRDLVRRSILHDTTESVWTNIMLLDFAGGALDALCNHTALEKSTSYIGDGTTVQFALPSDVYLSPAEFGLVYRYDPSSAANQPYYLFPVYTGGEISPNDQRAYMTWPATMLETAVPVPGNVELRVRYYAYWPHPVSDADELGIPSWATMAVALDIGIQALTWRTLAETGIGASRQRPDNGQPEQNAFMSTQKWWLQLYDRELSRQPRQNRMKPRQK